jgi:hypothetical protein
MIRKPNNWNEVQEFSDRQKLPLGAYVCKVKQVRIQDNSFGDQLCMLFDISEGEHAGFFQKDYNGNTAQDKKWRGVLRVWIPNDDGSEKDEITKRSFKGMVTAFEKSNPGYQWNWNENSLVGKDVGILFRNEEWDYNGKHGWAVRPFRAISVDTVRDESYTLPNDKPLSATTNTAPASTNNGYVEVTEDDLPF